MKEQKNYLKEIFVLIILNFCVNKSLQQNPVLLNSWSFNGDYSDSKGGANLTNGLNYGLTSDRFGNPNSALNLNYGYMNIPPGIYFNGTFTITAWVNVKNAVNLNDWLTIVYFGTGSNDWTNSVFTVFNGGGNNMIIKSAGPGNPQIWDPNSSLVLQRFSTGVWMHTAFTLDSNLQAKNYINGVQSSLLPPITTTKLTTTTAKPGPVLINSWAFNGDFSDSVGGANVTGGINYGLTFDRFGNPNSALNLTNGYVQLPQGIYFSGPYTVTVWVYPMQMSASTSRIFEFANGNGQYGWDAQFLSLTSLTIHWYNFIGTSPNILTSNRALTANSSWVHLAVTLDSSGIGTIYINGIPNVNKYMGLPSNVLRAYNYFGKSQWGDAYPVAYYDEMKIYNGSMDSASIMSGGHI